MKTKLIIALCLLSYLMQGQIIDDHWYILNGAGLNAANSNNTTLDYSNLISENSIIVENVNYPSVPNLDLTPHRIPRKNIFIILKDGSFVSSKNTEVKNLNGSTSNDLVNYIVKLTSKPSYMYWTEPYDEDDPRTNKNVENISSAFHPSTIDVTIDNTSTNALLENPLSSGTSAIWAHQDVVPGKDVVLVVKNRATTNPNKITVCYEKIHGEEIFSPSSVFGNQSNPTYVLYGSDPIAQGQLTIERDPNKTCIIIEPQGITPTPLYTYIALNTKSNAAELYAVDPEIIATFSTLCKNISCSTSEAVRAAHDPNYIKVMAVCEKNGKKFAKYHIEFQNDGEKSTNKVTLNFQLPQSIKPESGSLSKWFFGGTLRNSNHCNFNDITFIHDNDNNVYCKFPETITLEDMETNLEKSKGYIEFCAEVYSNRDLTSTVLQPIGSHTTFETVPFPVIDFIDPLTIDSIHSEGENIIIIQRSRKLSSSCPCPIASQPLFLPCKLDNLNIVLDIKTKEALGPQFSMKLSYLSDEITPDITIFKNNEPYPKERKELEIGKYKRQKKGEWPTTRDIKKINRILNYRLKEAFGNEYKATVFKNKKTGNLDIRFKGIKEPDIHWKQSQEKGKILSPN